MLLGGGGHPKVGGTSPWSPPGQGETGPEAMPDVYCPQPHGPHHPPASPGWGPCSGHTKQGAQGTKGGGRESPSPSPVSPPPASAGAGGRETKGPAIAGPSGPRPWQPSPCRPLAISHWPRAIGQPWPLPPPVAPSSACLAPHLSPCSLHLSVCLLPICPPSSCLWPGGGKREGGERWVPECLAEILLTHQHQHHNQHKPHNQHQPHNQHCPHSIVTR